jgi:hypothetical protein
VSKRKIFPQCSNIQTINVMDQKYGEKKEYAPDGSELP